MHTRATSGCKEWKIHSPFATFFTEFERALTIRIRNVVTYGADQHEHANFLLHEIRLMHRQIKCF